MLPFYRYVLVVLLLGGVLLPVSGCGLLGLGDEDDADEIVDPADANALTEVIVIPDARRRDGDPPPPSSSSEAPQAGGNAAEQTTSNGSTVNLPFAYSTTASLSGIYLQINGADSFFDIPISAASTQSGLITVPIQIPTNVSEGQFCTSYCVYDAENRVSNIIATCVDVLELGSGALQVSLSWNTNGTDVDLWVTDPGGTRIYYGNPESETGGQLDRDDTNGYGPENIFWLEDTAPDGEYLVEVDYYWGTARTEYVVTINAPETSRRFTGTLEEDEHHQVTRITKEGSRLRFSTPSEQDAAFDRTTLHLVKKSIEQ